MAPATPQLLTELSATLTAQMPILFSFVVFRGVAWASTACVFAPCVPARIAEAAVRVRRVAMAMGICAVLSVVGADPPPLTNVCAGYSAQRAQGATALLAVVVLMCSNRAVASALAISALKGVGDLMSAAVPLALCAAYAACGVRGETLALIIFTVYTLAHALACHDSKLSERTHATVLATIGLSSHLATSAGMALCRCCLTGPWRVRRALRSHPAPTAQRHPRGSAPLRLRVQPPRQPARPESPPHSARRPSPRRCRCSRCHLLRRSHRCPPHCCR